MKGAAQRAKAKDNNRNRKAEYEIKGNYKLERRKSKIHRWGVFTLEPIPARRRVIEYTGEIIDEEEMNRRSGKKLLYLFSVTDNKIIDGATGGSGAQFINHSCDGNLKSYIVNGRVMLSSIRPIEAGEELTYDYNIAEEFDVDCICGARKCRGKLGK